MLPTINIGLAVIPTATLVYILGIWLALIGVERAAARLQLHVPWTYNVAALALASGFVAARIAFVAMYWSAYRQNLLGILWPLTSGFNLWAGLLVAISAAFFYGRARRLDAGETLDALAPGLLIGAFAISLADFLAGPGYGTETDLLWRITLFGIARHPVQLYEMLTALAALAVWGWYLARRQFAGQLFLAATVVYGAGRLFFDEFRANAMVTGDGYHVVQIVALGAVLGAMLVLMRKSAAGEEREAAPDHDAARPER